MELKKKSPASTGRGFLESFLEEKRPYRRDSLSLSDHAGQSVEIHQGDRGEIFFLKEGQPQSQGVHVANHLMIDEGGVPVISVSQGERWRLEGNFSHVEKVDTPEDVSDVVLEDVQAQLG